MDNMQTTLYLTSVAATMCIIIGLGWGLLFNDWMVGGFLLLIGIMNAVRFWQVYKAR